MIAVLNGTTLLDTVKFSAMVCLHTKNKGSGIGFWLGVRALFLQITYTLLLCFSTYLLPSLLTQVAFSTKAKIQHASR